ncbi:MAG TPA: hypothetical protein VG206_10715 [Terriglobia bacterium]|nr:hypothetical protein [Terriglobia bacterium]
MSKVVTGCARNLWKPCEELKAIAAECVPNSGPECQQLKMIAFNPKEKAKRRLAVTKNLRDPKALTDLAASNENAQISGSAKSRLREVMNDDFMRAVEAGDITTMKALVAEGAAVDPHDVAHEINDLQRIRGGFQYRMVCEGGRLASPLMLAAIRSGRRDVVQTLIDLGGRVDGEYVVEQAHVSIGPLPEGAAWGAACDGLEFVVAPLFFLDGTRIAKSTNAPIPEKVATYVRYAQQLGKNEIAVLLQKTSLQ